MRKKVLAGMISLALMVTMAMPAFATGITTSLHQQELVNLAYMDLETADPALESKILEARSEIVLNTSWVADGIRGYVVDENNNILREVPQFHDVFPSDWDIPAFPAEKSSSEMAVTPQADSGYWDPRQYTVKLKNPSASQNTAPFTHFSTHALEGTPAEYEITEVMTNGWCTNRELDDPTYNIGYSNYNTGASLGLSTRMSESESFAIEPPFGIELAVRASTYSTPEDWLLTVACYRV